MTDVTGVGIRNLFSWESAKKCRNYAVWKRIATPVRGLARNDRPFQRPLKKGSQRPPDTRKHTVLPVSIRLKSTEKTPTCVSMRAFLQPISARIYFGKTASHRKRARLVQSRGASPQAYWMSVKAAQRRGCAKRAFCGVCFLMPGGLKAGRCLRVDKPTLLSFRTSDTGGQSRPPLQTVSIRYRLPDIIKIACTAPK